MWCRPALSLVLLVACAAPDLPDLGPLPAGPAPALLPMDQLVPGDPLIAAGADAALAGRAAALRARAAAMRGPVGDPATRDRLRAAIAAAAG
jgi:hypothetical protein